MTDTIIGTSQAAIDTYEEEVLAIFGKISTRVQELVTTAFNLVYEGPDAETVFNPGLITLATETVAAMNDAMTSFAEAVTVVTSNISQSLGAGEVVFSFVPPPLELPTPPGVAADDYRIDIAGFESFLANDLPDADQMITGLLADNVDAFSAIPRATADSPGWSGEARDYAQNVVVPAQTENLQTIWRQVITQVTDFMTSAKDGTLQADQTGATANPA